MSSRVLIPLAIGAALGAVTFGIGALAFGAASAGALLAGGAGFLIGSSIGSSFVFNGGGSGTSASAQKSRAQKLQISTASEGFPVPVIFGTCRVAGNYLRWSASTVRTEEIIKKVKISGGSSGGGGGKGGGGGGGGKKKKKEKTQKQVVGYKYFTSYEYGLCMGPIDGYRKVFSAPNQAIVASPDGVQYFGSDLTSFNLNGSKDEVGPVRLYRGSDTQTRESSSDSYAGSGMNYRHLCYAVFLSGFCVGRSPASKTYAFELQRMPKAYRDDGSTIDGFITRGSNDADHPCYEDANPAAIAFEYLTNKVWGRGLSSDDVDEDSFIAASVELASNNIGMSFQIDEQTPLSDVMDAIKEHSGLIVYESIGGKYKCKWIHSVESTSFQVVSVFDSSKLKGLRFNRPAWTAQTNEIRAEFLNRANSYTSQLVIAQDLAAINTIGIINSKRISLLGISNSSTAQNIANRILKENSYPLASLEFYMSRYSSYLEPMDLIQLNWDEWNDDRVISYWRVLSVTDDEQSEDGIKVTFVEDLYLSSTTEDSPSIGTPIPPVLDTTDEDLTDDNELEFSPFTPCRGFELNVYAANKDTAIAFFIQPQDQYTVGVNIYWALEASGNYNEMQFLSCLSISGTLVDDYDVSYEIDRSLTGIVATLSQDERDSTDFLSVAKVPSQDDHIEVINQEETAYLIIGNEVMKVGYIEDLGGGEYRITAIQRGIFSTPIENHPAGSVFFFIKEFNEPTYVLTANDIALDPNQVEFALHSVINEKANEAGYTTIYVNSDHRIKALGRRAFPPNLYSITGAGTKTIKVRPRLIDVGAGIDTDFQSAMNTLCTDIEDQKYMVIPYDGADVALADIQVAYGTYTPDDGNDPLTGLYSFDYTPPVGATYIKVWSQREGLLSIDALTINL